MAFKRPDNPLLTISAWIGAVIVILGGVIAAGDSRYAPKDELVVLQQAKSIDSLNYLRDQREVLASIARLDSNVTCVRKPEKDWCK